jgi:hypothetical protein
MSYGPVDFLAIEFKGNQFKGEIMPALLDLVNNEIVRVIDLVIVTKDAAGKVTMRELQQVESAVVAMFDPLKAQITGMIQQEDIELIGQKVENNTTAAIMLFENLWSIKFRDAVLNANGRVVMFERIPANVVNETLDNFASAGE